MRHHLRRAKHVYETRGLVETVRAALGYAPIELNNLAFRSRYGSGTRVMDEKWDTLVVLDACRYDMFADRAEAFAGRLDADCRLESRISLGSTSEEFLECNFANGTFHDTVYVNTNPYLPRLGLDDGTFHAVVDLLSAWDDDRQTVHPETVVEAALDARDRFPNKRLIVHFMQPHYPFIGEVGRRIDARGWWADASAADPGSDGGAVDGDSVWQRLRNGDDLDIELVWRAYRENLDVALDHAETLLADLPGRTVLSADHGNLVGERFRPIPSRRKYGHPYGVYLPELVRVPWFVVESTDRPAIRADPPIEQRSPSETDVTDRLEALGYR
ncbi:AlkP-core domain protein [Natronomonas moolapensis 8.8.11]|uniref:AlkP-core domain protein n=1 Tax=Natronomonas moolapensis (strain DSM 18674 / CECT 7526 / JCM 14361 / 8.8.11) TaxID=268739 RepID=M1Y536_NATM8|nr:hypothetical protein [Natronomonas moolapensis]CCQ37657.1 AlkP-core domain protein [Natronomonas moolapensis 8.8.11]